MYMYDYVCFTVSNVVKYDVASVGVFVNSSCVTPSEGDDELSFDPDDIIENIEQVRLH